MENNNLFDDDKNIIRKIGLKVRKKRKQAGLTQEQVAEFMDCSITTISRLENGQQLMSLVNLIRLAEILDTDISEFLSDFTIKQDITLRSDDDRFLLLLKQYTPQQKEFIYESMKWFLENFPDFSPSDR